MMKKFTVQNFRIVSKLIRKGHQVVNVYVDRNEQLRFQFEATDKFLEDYTKIKNNL